MSKFAITFTQPTLAQQHTKDAVDINQIMARYIKTGVLDHVTKYQPQYTDNTMQDYQQSQNIIIKADLMFSELPSQVRKNFGNDPAAFLDFVSDESNHDKLAEMGLTQPQAERPAPAKNKKEKKSKEKTAVTTNSEQTPSEEDA